MQFPKGPTTEINAQKNLKHESQKIISVCSDFVQNTLYLKYQRLTRTPVNISAFCDAV